MDQGTAEWHQARLGKLTASRLTDAIAKTKTGWGASRANLLALLLTERLTGQTVETFKNAAMIWGTETEPQARAHYALTTGVDVTEVGFIDHPVIAMSGASPDGCIGSDGLLEIKCPNTATHLDTLLSGKGSASYFTQMQWQMACTGRKWCDFVSFDPRLPEHLRLYVERIPRDAAYIAELEAMAVEFLAELDDRLGKLKAFRPLQVAA